MLSQGNNGRNIELFKILTKAELQKRLQKRLKKAKKKAALRYVSSVFIAWVAWQFLTQGLWLVEYGLTSHQTHYFGDGGVDCGISQDCSHSQR